MAIIPPTHDGRRRASARSRTDQQRESRDGRHPTGEVTRAVEINVALRRRSSSPAFAPRASADAIGRVAVFRRRTPGGGRQVMMMMMMMIGSFGRH
jgi:hypothetical protein